MKNFNGVGRQVCLAVVLFGFSRAAALSAQAAEPAWPTLPKEGPILVLPKGKTATATGMTAKDGVPAKEPTVVTVTWDDEGLTVAFDCTDAGVVAEWAKARDSDKTWKDDSVAVLLDVGHRHVASLNFLSFKLSAAGGLQDSRGVSRDISFNVPGITSEVGRTDAGWRGMIRIPWKGLGVTPKDGDVWGVQFTRINHHGKYAGMAAAEITAWAPFREDFEGLQQFGHLVFGGSEMAAREKIMREHAAAADNSMFPHEGHVLTATAKQPGTATGFTVVTSGAAPNQPTTVSVSWAEKGLDVMFDCVDTGVFGEQKGRDNIKLWKDDSVYVFLDPGHAHSATRDHIMVQLSFSGEVYDEANGDAKFDVANLVTEVARTDKGWRAHLRLPWKGMGVECPKPGDAWGCNFMRMDQPGKLDFQNMQSSSWLPILDGDILAVDRWGHVIFAVTDADAAAGQEAIKTSHAARRAAIVEKSK